MTDFDVFQLQLVIIILTLLGTFVLMWGHHHHFTLWNGSYGDFYLQNKEYFTIFFYMHQYNKTYVIKSNIKIHIHLNKQQLW